MTKELRDARERFLADNYQQRGVMAMPSEQQHADALLLADAYCRLTEERREYPKCPCGKNYCYCPCNDFKACTYGTQSRLVSEWRDVTEGT